MKKKCVFPDLFQFPSTSAEEDLVLPGLHHTDPLRLDDGHGRRGLGRGRIEDGEGRPR